MALNDGDWKSQGYTSESAFKDAAQAQLLKGYNPWDDFGAGDAMARAKSLLGSGSTTAYLAPRPGETEDEYFARVGASNPGFVAHLQQMKRTDPASYQKFIGSKLTVDPAQQKAQAEADANKTREADIRAQLDDFSRWANRPLDQMMRDPDVQQMIQSAQATTQNNDRLNGIQGGLSNANSEKSMYDAGLAIQNQRKQMALNAMGTQLQDVNQVNQLRENARQFDVNGYNQSLQNQYAAKQAQYQTVGALGGGLIGAVGGGLVGGPMGAAVGASAGSSIGAGAAGGLAGAPPAYRSYVPPSAGSGGGLSGRNY